MIRIYRHQDGVTQRVDAVDPAWLTADSGPIAIGFSAKIAAFQILR